MKFLIASLILLCTLTMSAAAMALEADDYNALHYCRIHFHFLLGKYSYDKGFTGCEKLVPEIEALIKQEDDRQQRDAEKEEIDQVNQAVHRLRLQ